MPERFDLPTPIWWVQYHLLGGPRRLVMIGTIYVMAVAVGAMAYWRLIPQQTLTTTANFVLKLAAWAQGILLVIAGCSAVHKGMVRDFDTKMIESHRLTPMGNLTVVVGYLFGPTLRILFLALINGIMGVALIFILGGSVRDWVLGNAAILGGAVMLWSVVVCSGVSTNKPQSPMPALIGLGMIGVLLLALPGAGLVTGAYAISIGMAILLGGTSATATIVCATLMVNGLLAMLWLSAAAAKYRRPDLPAFTAVRGLLLLVVWVLASAVGVLALPAIAGAGPSTFLMKEVAPEMQWSAGLIGSLLFAGVAIGGTVRCNELIKRGAAPRDAADRVPGILVAVVSVALMCGVPAVVASPVWRELLTAGVADPSTAGVLAHPWTVSIAVCLLATLAIWALFTAAYRIARSAKWPVLLFVLAAWATPPLVDVIRAETQRGGYGHPTAYSWLMGCSPVGALMAAWDQDIHVDLRPGLALQAAITTALCSIVFVVRRRSKSAPDRRAAVAR